MLTQWRTNDGFVHHFQEDYLVDQGGHEGKQALVDVHPADCVPVYDFNEDHLPGLDYCNNCEDRIQKELLKRVLKFELQPDSRCEEVV